MSAARMTGPGPWRRPRAPAPGTTPVPSPCVDVCRMQAETDLCEGCARTIDDIIAWATLDDAGKRAIWALLPERFERIDRAAGRSPAPDAPPA